MRERGDILVGLMVTMLLLFPAGYVLHVSPRFPGSLAGGVTGILAVALMLLTLPYVAMKHWAAADHLLSKAAGKSTWLAVHVYAGVAAPILALIHAAHTMSSPMGLLLTGLLLVTVLSGYVGRYFLGELAHALRGRKSELATLKAAFLQLPATARPSDNGPRPSGWRRLFFVAAEPSEGDEGLEAEALAAAVADTEYAIRAEEATNAMFSRWRILHIVVAVALYLLLLIHIGAAVYFGLRWL
jgi:hypothetical protein